MRKSTKLKIFRRKKRSVILSVLKRHSLRQHTVIILFLEIKSTFMAKTIGDGKLLMVTVINLHLSTKLTGKMKLKNILITERF